jgi:ABC-type phosphate transport system permease subunit
MFPGPVAQSKKAFTRHVRHADLLKAGPVAVWLYLAWNLSFLYLDDIFAWLIIFMVTFITTLGAIPSAWPVAIGMGPRVFYNPWARQSF